MRIFSRLGRNSLRIGYALAWVTHVGSLHAQRAPAGELQLGSRIWTVGVEAGDPRQEFGKLLAATTDPQGRTYLLDADPMSIHIVDRNGSITGRFGRLGRGPGEFNEPRAMVHDGVNTLYVLDRTNGLMLFDTRGALPKLRRTILLRTFSDDVCLMDRNTIVLHGRTASNDHVSVVDSLGRVRRTFGRMAGDTTNPQVARTMNGSGFVACLPSTGQVVRGVRSLPEVHVYDVRGVLQHAYRHPGFVSIKAMPLANGQIAYGPPTANGNNRQGRIIVLDDTHVLLQYDWSKAATDLPVTSCVLSLPKGVCSPRRTDLPIIAAVGDSAATAMSNDPFAQATHFRLVRRPL